MKRPANETCPFSHEPMEEATSIDLRCGHRFALARLGAARRAAELCCAAGFARKDALICPLCGDEAIAKTGTGKTLTTYSADTDAYLGDLRKDYQEPLRLPTQAGLFPALSNLSGGSRTERPRTSSG